MNAARIDGRKYWNNLIHCCRRCSFLALSQLATSPPRHSGLAPESSSYPVMDPGSKSPRGLGDVRDDVCSALPANVLHVIPGLTRNPVHIPTHGSRSLASSERREHGRQEEMERTTHCCRRFSAPMPALTITFHPSKTPPKIPSPIPQKKAQNSPAKTLTRYKG